MVISLKRAVLLFALLLILSGNTVAGDDRDRDREARAALALTLPPAKSVDDRDRHVRVALAFAPHTVKPVFIGTAPPPRDKGKLCPCGAGCQCPADKCPACPTAKAELSRIRDALVRVRCGDAQGSGTVIWSESGKSVVLTAAHVIAGGGDLTVRGEGKTHKADVLGRDDGADLAALLVSVELPAVTVSAADPRDGAEVLMVGMTSLWSRGRIHGTSTLTGRAIYLIDYDSDHGDSGAGVFVAGELVGVHCGKVSLTPGSAGTPYCTGAKPVRAFVATCFARKAPAPSASVIEPPAKKLIGYRCQIVNGRKMCVPVYEP